MVDVIFGTIPTPPAIVDANVIRALRSPFGERPCSDGLRAALAWIGERSLPFDEAVAEAELSATVSDYVPWAMEAIGYGDGDGSGYGYGSGYGDGSGYGYGYGDGSGYGYGDGDGSGYGYGSGSSER